MNGPNKIKGCNHQILLVHCWMLCLICGHHTLEQCKKFPERLRLMYMFRSSRRKVFCKIGVLRNFAKFTGKHLCQSLFFNKVSRPVTLLKKRLWHRCFPKKFVRITFLNRTHLVAASSCLQLFNRNHFSQYF